MVLDVDVAEAKVLGFGFSFYFAAVVMVDLVAAVAVVVVEMIVVHGFGLFYCFAAVETTEQLLLQTANKKSYKKPVFTGFF